MFSLLVRIRAFDERFATTGEGATGGTRMKNQKG
jgi:hypothetical protein